MILLPKESQRKTKAAITRKQIFKPRGAGGREAGDLRMFLPNPTSYLSL